MTDVSRETPPQIELPLELQRAGFALANDEAAIVAGATALNDEDAPADPLVIALKELQRGQKAICDRLTQIEKFIGQFFEDDNSDQIS